MTRTLTIAGNLLFTVIAVLVGGGILGLTVLPNLLRYQTYVVLSGSMEPAIHTGSVIVATAVDPKTLQIGDVITFISDSKQENVTHRIVALHGDAQGRVSFITRGDANGADDPEEIRFDHMAGKVTLSVPYLGYFFKFIGSPSMRLLFIIVPGMLLLGSWLWEIWRPEPKARPPDVPVPQGMAPASAAPRSAHGEQNVAIGHEPDASGTVPLRR